MRVGVFGAGGRMGSTVCRAVAADPELELVAAVDPRYAGIDLRQVIGLEEPRLQVAADADALARAGADVGVDFTEASAARENLRWCAANAVHAVSGTTGLTDEDLAEARSIFVDGVNCVLAPNFAIGAVLMMRFAEMAAPWFETAEVIELHHDQKVDAPSGTAMLAAERIAAASSEWADDPTRHQVMDGVRGGRAPGGVRVHSVRLRGLVAHHEVLLGTTGQCLSLRHDSYDRSSFMPGVLLALRSVGERPGVTLGLDALLGL